MTALTPEGLAERGLRVEGDVAYVPLTRGYEAIVDAADVDIVGGYLWHVKINHRWGEYAARNHTDPATGKRRTIRMHRAIMGEPGVLVDHVNRNGLDNRRSNLRLANGSENNCNKGVARNSSTGIKGVTFHKATGKWRAQIKSGSRIKHLGLFSTPEHAAAAYAKASNDLHGAFGRAAIRAEAATILKGEKP